MTSAKLKLGVLVSTSSFQVALKYKMSGDMTEDCHTVCLATKWVQPEARSAEAMHSFWEVFYQDFDMDTKFVACC